MNIRRCKILKPSVSCACGEAFDAGVSLRAEVVGRSPLWCGEPWWGGCADKNAPELPAVGVAPPMPRGQPAPLRGGM